MNDCCQNEQRHLTITISFDQTPEQAFEAINNVRGWWSGDIEGPTDVLEGEFSYRYQDFHFSKQKITELLPGKKVVWQIVDSYLGFVANTREWNGTEVIFDITRKGGKTEVRFTHAGLVPAHECYSDCSRAWGSYIRGSLRSLITTQQGQPNPKKPAQRSNGSATRT
jgi:hypothetical protein